MNIIQKQPNSSGAYPPIQSWSGEVPPETHFEITCDYGEFFNGFIIPTVENDKVISIVCNTELWEAWKATPAPGPTPTEQIAALKAQLSASDYKVIKCAECSLAGLPSPYDITELNAERQAIRDQINALEATIQ